MSKSDSRRHTGARCDEAAELIFGNQEPADLNTAGRIEFDR